MALTRDWDERKSTTPGPHMLTPPPNHATSVRHYCPLYAATPWPEGAEFRKTLFLERSSCASRGGIAPGLYCTVPKQRGPGPPGSGGGAEVGVA